MVMNGNWPIEARIHDAVRDDAQFVSTHDRMRHYLGRAMLETGLEFPADPENITAGEGLVLDMMLRGELPVRPTEDPALLARRIDDATVLGDIAQRYDRR